MSTQPNFSQTINNLLEANNVSFMCGLADTYKDQELLGTFQDLLQQVAHNLKALEKYPEVTTLFHNLVEAAAPNEQHQPFSKAAYEAARLLVFLDPRIITAIDLHPKFKEFLENVASPELPASQIFEAVHNTMENGFGQILVCGTRTSEANALIEIISKNTNKQNIPKIIKELDSYGKASRLASYTNVHGLLKQAMEQGEDLLDIIKVIKTEGKEELLSALSPHSELIATLSCKLYNEEGFSLTEHLRESTKESIDTQGGFAAWVAKGALYTQKGIEVLNIQTPPTAGVTKSQKTPGQKPKGVEPAVS